MRRPLPLPTLLLVLSLHACAHPRPAPTTAVAEPAPPPLAWEPPAAPPRPISTAPLALVGGTVLTAAGQPIERGVVLMRDGLIEAVGPAGEVPLPRGVTVIDVGGRVVTPGLIDTHSHMGVYPVPAARAHLDGNEASAPVTAHVRAFDSFWPQDPALPKALAGGVTTIQVLPGSANLIGGQGAIMKLRPGRSASAMAFPGAPATLKMACGENPKRVHGENRKTAPSTRMGNVAGYRAAYQAALEYGQKLREWQGKHMLWQTKKAKFDEARAKAQHTAAAHGPDATAGRVGRAPPASARTTPVRRPCSRRATSASRRCSERSREGCSCRCTATAPTRWCA